MFTVLVVERDSRASRAPAARMEEAHASVEVLRAFGADEALEKLGRNRRIDAVLLLEEPGRALDTFAAIREENPAPPPVFLPRPEASDGSSPPEGARFVGGGSPSELLAAVIAELGR